MTPWDGSGARVRVKPSSVRDLSDAVQCPINSVTHVLRAPDERVIGQDAFSTWQQPNGASGAIAAWVTLIAAWDVLGVARVLVFGVAGRFELDGAVFNVEVVGEALS